MRVWYHIFPPRNVRDAMKNTTKCLFAIAMAAAAISANAETKIWTGLGANAKASTAENWQAAEGADSAAPVAGDPIVLTDVGADGEARSANYYSGSGGSIWIEAGSIGGSGSITSDGNGGGDGMGGSGGCIAIYLTGEGETLGETPARSSGSTRRSSC